MRWDHVVAWVDEQWLPLTPGGLGVVDSITPLLLVSFGVTRSLATLGSSAGGW
jgi:hypothetical protein